jgi:hypothetical protein
VGHRWGCTSSRIQLTHRARKPPGFNPFCAYEVKTQFRNSLAKMQLVPLRIVPGPGDPVGRCRLNQVDP